MKGILCIRLVICVHLLSITKGKNGARSSFVHTNELLTPLHVYMYMVHYFCYLLSTGSTDAIAFCTTGNNDPITSALHIILGKLNAISIQSRYHQYLDLKDSLITEDRLTQ